MRIIAGEFRGRKLLAPDSEVTRPITDRVKQSLFDILTPMIDGAVIYDCFCGTGSMGLESLSRGAAHATFFEGDRSALQRLRQNISALNVAGRSTVVAGDLFRWGRGALVPARRADIIFFDPPYRFLVEDAAELQTLGQHFAGFHLAPLGTVVFRHDAADRLNLPGLARYDERTYGGMTLEFLRLTNAAAG